MVHPRELLRVDSNDRGSQFSAPIESLYNNPIDCGIAVFPCLNRCINLEKFAKVKVLAFLLAHTGVFQGALYSYFLGTSTIWKKQYGLSDVLFECFLHLNEIFIGFTALSVAYWGNRIHRASWIGGIAIFQAIAGLSLIIPEVYDPFSGKTFPQDDSYALCGATNNFTMANETQNDLNHTGIGILFIYQLFSAFGSIALYALSASYLDDSVDMTNTPICIAVILLSKEIGKQIGMNLSWTVVSQDSPRVFLSPAFLAISLALFLHGCLIAMFPKELPSVLLKKAVASILDLAGGGVIVKEVEETDKFFESLWRLLKNKILIINITASTLVYSVVVNFDQMKPLFYQSYFHLPSKLFDPSGYNDPWISQITTNLIKQPFVALAMISIGFLISKFKLTAKSLLFCNIQIIIFAVITYGTLVFYPCQNTIQTELNDKITTPYCSSMCSCSEDILFSPVCLESSDVTYFSPCHAGCSTIEETNDVKIFGNCTCGKNIHITINAKATLGACNRSCTSIWATTHANDILAAGALATSIVISFFITLRCVKAKDKCLALGLHVTFNGFLPYIPFRLTYLTLADTFCQYKNSRGKCRLHSRWMGFSFITMSVVLLITAIIFNILLRYFVKNLELYFDPTEESPKNRVNDEELEDLESKRDNNGRDNLFRTSSPSTNGNQAARLKDFSPEPEAIQEETHNNNTAHGMENDRLLRHEPEILDFTIARTSPEEVHVLIHSAPQDRDDVIFQRNEDRVDNRKTNAQVLESNF